VLRFLTVALDKHAAAYADKRKGLIAEGRTKRKKQRQLTANHEEDNGST